MSTSFGNGQRNSSKPVVLAERRLSQGRFQPLYQEGMALVEEAANYLDGEGRDAAKMLSRETGVIYAAESMRMTTRLMQVASWLLLLRAANNGEMSHEQVQSEKRKVKLDTASTPPDTPGFSELPEAFTDLVDRSLDMQRRIRKLDADVQAPIDVLPASVAKNPVNDQLGLLQSAFATK